MKLPVTDDPVKRMLWAAETGNEETVRSLLQESKELVWVSDSDGYTPLHRASYEEHTDIMQVNITQDIQCMAFNLFT